MQGAGCRVQGAGFRVQGTERLARVLAGGPRGEEVPELRVGELVDPAVVAHLM